jgi:hypothetical protein
MSNTVEEILDQWYGPDHVYFKCRVDKDNLYILRRAVPDGPWELVSLVITSGLPTIRTQSGVTAGSLDARAFVGTRGD